jgi:hypothetical protein
MPQWRFPLLGLAIGLAGTATQAQEDLAIAELMLSSGATACKDRNVDSFFEIFLQSEAVRKAYTRDSLDLVTNGASGRSTTTIDGKSYDAFPLAIFDYYYTTAQGVDENGYTHVLIEKNLSSDNRLRVDWMRVSYDGQGEGDDPGNIIEKGAELGYLLFCPTDDCWELVSVSTTQPQDAPVWHEPLRN